MTFIRHLLFAVTLVFAGAAFALDLDSAKSQGLVGEQPNGYLGVVKATSEAVELVSDVVRRGCASRRRGLMCECCSLRTPCVPQNRGDIGSSLADRSRTTGATASGDGNGRDHAAGPLLTMPKTSE